MILILLLIRFTTLKIPLILDEISFTLNFLSQGIKKMNNKKKKEKGFV